MSKRFVVLAAAMAALLGVLFVRSSLEGVASPSQAWTDCGQALYVANEGNGGGGTTVVRADCNGNISTFATGFTGTSGLVADATYLYISDDSPGIFRVDSAGTITPWAPTASFGNPNGLAIDSLGRIVVADAGDRILRLTVDGAGNLITEETLAQGFAIPQGVVETPGGDILFTDAEGYVYRIDSTTTLPITSPATAQRLAVGQVVPGNEGSVKLDSAGNIYTANTGGRIVRIDPAGTTAKAVVDIPHVACPPGQGGPFVTRPAFRGLEFTPDGDLVATGYCLDNVYILPMTDIDVAWNSGIPIATLPAPFIQNPSGALDGPDLNGPFGIAFFGANVPPVFAPTRPPPLGGTAGYPDFSSGDNGGMVAGVAAAAAAVLALGGAAWYARRRRVS